MVQLGEHFAGKDRGHHIDGLGQRHWFIKAREDHQRREKSQDRLDDDFVALASEAILASQAQIAAFEVKLTKYDEATVQALMDNQEQLDAVEARINAMLEQAHVMDDGRRVFKTEDGTQVFDEHGAEVSAIELDPLSIDPSRPSWEAYSAERTTEADLIAERTEIIEYQAKLDDAREQIAEGDISEADLEALDADLLEMMPDAVRTHVPDLEPRADAPDLVTQSTAPTASPVAQTQSAEASAPAPSPM